MEDIDIEVNETDKQKQHNNARKHDENDDELVSKFALDVMLFERKDKASFFERDGSLTESKSFFDGKLIGGFHTKADFDAFFDGLSANLAEGGDGRIVEYTFTTDRTKIPLGLY